MQQSEAIHILQCLVDGIDPHTGEEIPINNPVRHLKTVRALRLALKAMRGVMSSVQEFAEENAADATACSVASTGKKRLSARVGETWTKHEDEELAKQYDDGMELEEMAVKHGRTLGAIRSRLLRLGRMP